MDRAALMKTLKSLAEAVNATSQANVRILNGERAAALELVEISQAALLRCHDAINELGDSLDISE